MPGKKLPPFLFWFLNMPIICQHVRDLISDMHVQNNNIEIADKRCLHTFATLP